MFRGLRERRGDRPAVGPEWEGGAPATRRVGASSEKNQEQNISRDTKGKPQSERCNTPGPGEVILSEWDIFWLVLSNAGNCAEQKQIKPAELRVQRLNAWEMSSQVVEYDLLVC